MDKPTDRVAGMVIADGTAALVVLAREGEGWRVEKASKFPPHPYALHDNWPDCPVVLDATGWDLGVEFGEALSDHLRTAGWDVRPPRWEGGRAANPSMDELCAVSLQVTSNGEQLHTHALLLAAWGATMPTSAAPSVEHVDRGPGATHNEAGTCCLPALRSEDDPPRASDDALAYVRDDLAGLARREAGHVEGIEDVRAQLTEAREEIAGLREQLTHAQNTAERRAREWSDEAERIMRQRDEAEAALWALMDVWTADRFEQIEPWRNARALLVRRGKMQEGQ